MRKSIHVKAPESMDPTKNIPGGTILEQAMIISGGSSGIDNNTKDRSFELFVASDAELEIAKERLRKAGFEIVEPKLQQVVGKIRNLFGRAEN